MAMYAGTGVGEVTEILSAAEVMQLLLGVE
jgi:hypothetical protein